MRLQLNEDDRMHLDLNTDSKGEAKPKSSDSYHSALGGWTAPIALTSWYWPIPRGTCSA